MFKIDLIIPSLISYQKYPKLQKFQKFQKFQHIPFPFWSGNWFPVWLNLKTFKNMGLKIRFLNFTNLHNKKLSKTVGIDSRIINNLIFKYGYLNETQKKEIIPLLDHLRKKVDYLLYFDNSDSTGHFHYDIIPYVDKYFKKQLLKDREIYKKPLYGKRLFTDYYARNYSLDANLESKKGFESISIFKNKIDLSWNFAFKDYRYSNLLTRILYGFSRNVNLKYYKPNINRKTILAANYTIKSSYGLIYFQRNQLLKTLKERYNSNKNFSLGKIPKKNYLRTMRTSKTVVSPYGWGEICYRDFESYIAGAALIKPDMDHLETWPNLYKKNETYISIPWKLEDWVDIFPEILADSKLLLEVAKNGQESYKKLWTREGRTKFCEHFIEIITPK